MRSILDLSFIPSGTQVSRNGAFIPCLNYCFYVNLNCTDASDIVRRLDAHDEHMSSQIKVELIEVIQESTPECPWDAND